MGNSLVLVGPRCSGKTSTGNALAEILDVRCIDADELFVQTFNKSIDEFVKEYSWEIFRKYESKIIERICEEYEDIQIVLTPGGGAVAHNQGDKYRKENKKNLSKFGTVVYLLPTAGLEESARILYARMTGNPNTAGQRPNLTDENDPFQEMLKVVKERHSHYMLASDALAYTEGKTVQEVAKEIVALAR